MLEQDLEAFAHALGKDQRFELEAGAKAGGVVHAIVIEVGEIISLPQREKKRGLCDQTESFKTVALAPLAERGEIDVRGKVLLAGGCVEVFICTVIGVGEDGAGHVVRIKEVGGLVAIVDGEDEAAIEAASDFADPVAGFKASFGVLSILQRDLLCGEILGDGTGGKRHGELGEAGAIRGDEHFAEDVLLLKDAVDRERVEKFVGKEAAGGNARGNFDRRSALPFLGEASEARCKLLTTGRRALDRDVAKTIVELRKLRLSELEDMASETAHACASFDKKKFCGTI